MEDLRDAENELGCSLFSVLIDIGPSSLGAIEEFSDRFATVTRLAEDFARDLFLEI